MEREVPPTDQEERLNPGGPLGTHIDEEMKSVEHIQHHLEKDKPIQGVASQDTESWRSCLYHHLGCPKDIAALSSEDCFTQESIQPEHDQQLAQVSATPTTRDLAGMRLAIKVASAAFQCNEVPVSCVFVSSKVGSEGKIVTKVEASAHNLTSKLKNVQL